MSRSKSSNALRTWSRDGSGSTAASYYGDRGPRGGRGRFVRCPAMRRCGTLAADRGTRGSPAGGHMTAPKDKRALRSRLWFDDASNPGMTALYLERYLNFGLTRGELQS